MRCMRDLLTSTQQAMACHATASSIDEASMRKCFLFDVEIKIVAYYLYNRHGGLINKNWPCDPDCVNQRKFDDIATEQWSGLEYGIFLSIALDHLALEKTLLFHWLAFWVEPHFHWRFEWNHIPVIHPRMYVGCNKWSGDGGSYKTIRHVSGGENDYRPRCLCSKSLKRWRVVVLCS